jgi:hypothetical protein
MDHFEMMFGDFIRERDDPLSTFFLTGGSAMATTSKEYWTGRATAFFNTKKATLMEKHAAVVSRIRAEAEKKAIKALGIEAEVAERKKLDAQLANLNQQEAALRVKQGDVQRRMNVKLYGSATQGFFSTRADDKIKKQIDLEARELSARDPVAKIFLEIEQQQTKFLDLLHSDAKAKELQAAWQEITGGE